MSFCLENYFPRTFKATCFLSFSVSMDMGASLSLRLHASLKRTALPVLSLSLMEPESFSKAMPSPAGLVEHSAMSAKRRHSASFSLPSFTFYQSTCASCSAKKLSPHQARVLHL